MAQNQIFLRSILSGKFPHRWSVVLGRMLAMLVVFAALVQVIPVGVGSSLTFAADSEQQTSVCGSLDASTHAAARWSTQSVGACRLVGIASRDAELSQGGFGLISSDLVSLSRLQSCEKQGSVDWDSCCLLTLVDWNVRLQI